MKKITLLHSDITDDIFKAFFHVDNSLGYGFLEKVYENSMVHVLKNMKHSVKQQHPITVWFDCIVVGEYFTDVLVDEIVIVELRAVEVISKEHEAQLLNYLRATQIEVGLLLNFGKNLNSNEEHFQTPTNDSRQSNRSASSAFYSFLFVHRYYS